MKKTRTKNKVYRIIMIAFFIALAAIILLPFWAIFIGTFQEGSMLIRYGLNLTLDFCSIFGKKSENEKCTNQNSTRA